MTWGQLRTYLASLFGSSSWSNLSATNQNLGQQVLNDAIAFVWPYLHPSLRVKESAIRFREAEDDVQITAVAGNNYVTTTSSITGMLMHQKIIFNNEGHQIDDIKIDGGTTYFFFNNDTVEDDYTGDEGYLDFITYLLPADFEAFDEAPHDYTFVGGTLDENTYENTSDYLIDPRMILSDYIPETGTLNITKETDGQYNFYGVDTAWTADLVDQQIITQGRIWLIREVYPDSLPQEAKPWFFQSTGSGDVADASGTGLSYTLKLKGRRAVRLYTSARRDFRFVYRVLPPSDGFDDEAIPIPHVRPVHLAINYYWMIQTDTGHNITNNLERVSLLNALMDALHELARATNPQPSAPKQYRLSASEHPSQRRRDIRVRQINYGTATNNPNRPFPRDFR